MSISEEHRNIFSNPTRHVRVPLQPYSRPTRRPPMWTHNFLCLASRLCTQVPSRQDKEKLSAAGLGEKRVQIGLSASATHLNDKLLLVFPKLHQAGGYELLRCLHNSRSLCQLQPPPGGFTPVYLRSEVGNARLYIRPARYDLSIEQGITSVQVRHSIYTHILYVNVRMARLSDWNMVLL